MKHISKLALLTIVSLSLVIGAASGAERKQLIQSTKLTEIQRVQLNEATKNAQRLVNNGKLQFTDEEINVQGMNGYICDVSNDTCLCSGDATSQDCQDMFENICETDSSDNPIYSCLPGGCVCRIYDGSFDGGGGGIDNPSRALTPGG